MRNLLTGAVVFIVVPTSWAAAGAPITREQASKTVLADGFSYVSKTEAAPGSWDVWASRDGIAYEIKIDARSGSVLKEVPLEEDD